MKFDVLLIDPPWHHYGDGQKNAAAGKHYRLMSDASVQALPVRTLLNARAYVFVWATTPRLDAAISAINAWGLNYRGVGHIWVKTRRDGQIIHAQGVPPTYSKPTTELLLVATTTRTGRPMPLLSSKLPQVVLAPRAGHSEKPAVFRELIEQAVGLHARKVELFARCQTSGWVALGDAVCDGEDIVASIRRVAAL